MPQSFEESMNEAERLIELANGRLRSGKVGIVIEVRGRQDWLYLRGTFPPKPDSSKTRPHQQRIALKMRATPVAIKQAEATAKVVGGELNLGKFDWSKWSDAEPTHAPKAAGKWIEDFEAHWWQTRSRLDPSKLNTWQRCYRGPLNNLPVNADLTTDLLLNWITDNTEPESRRRGQYVTCARAIAKFAGLEVGAFKGLGVGYNLKAVNPRDLPSDREIAETYETIQDPGWRFLYGLMATYGLRNHECFKVDLADFPVVRVLGRTKTESRAVKPLYPEWAEAWRLHERILPERIDLPKNASDLSTLSNDLLGRKISAFFRRSLPWTAYNLRHCFARRCAEFEIPAPTASRLMGHDLFIHEKVYKAWVGERVYLDSVDKAIARTDRPMPPSL